MKTQYSVLTVSLLLSMTRHQSTLGTIKALSECPRNGTSAICGFPHLRLSAGFCQNIPDFFEEVLGPDGQREEQCTRGFLLRSDAHFVVIARLSEVVPSFVIYQLQQVESVPIPLS